MEHKVLVVDDSKLARMVMANALRRLQPGWDLIEASSSIEALDVVTSSAPDMALVDFNMPNMDGLELIAELRKLRPSMPIAVVSANVQAEVIGRAKELNAAFIPKPVTDEALGAYLTGAALRLKTRV